MASGVNFNPSSFQIPGNAGVQRHQGVTPQEQPVANPTDGFQASGQMAQPNATAAVNPQVITLACTPEQLGTAAFQQTIATLSASGFQVTLALQSAGGAQPAPTPPSQAGCKDEVDQLRHELRNVVGHTESKGAQVRQEVAQLRDELHNIKSQIGYIADAVTKPAPSRPSPPSYGGD